MAAKRFPDRQPTHPGAILREDVLPEPRMPVAEFATRLGVSRQMLHGILREQHAVTPLGRLLGNGAGLSLRMQQAHDRWRVECDKANELAISQRLQLPASCTTANNPSLGRGDTARRTPCRP